MTSTTNYDQRVAQYDDCVRADLKPVVKKILNTHFADVHQWDAIKIAGALQLYVYEKIEYDHTYAEIDSRPVRDPFEVWKLGGTCEGQNVFLASLFRSIKAVKSRLLIVDSPGDETTHLVCEAGFDTSQRSVENSLNELYSETRHFNCTFDGYLFESRSGWLWIVADVTHCRYLGDPKNLEGAGMIYRFENGEWEWVSVLANCYC